jgi:hypothetical protein
MNDAQRDELLIRLDERQQSIHDCLKDHLAKHWKIELLALASGLSFLGALALAIFAR